MTQHRDDLIVLLVLVGGLVSNSYAPLWLAPPLFEYTIWIYILLFLAWIPVYIALMRGKRRGRLMGPFIGVALFVTCFGCIVLPPRSAFGVNFIFDTVQCVAQPADEGRVRYACTRLSLDGPEFDQTWVLEGVAGLPVLWIVETEGW